MTSGDLVAAAELCVQVLEPHLGEDWTIPAGDLDWDCRTTLEHIVDDLWFYAAHLATRSRERLPFTRDGAPTASLSEVLRLVPSSAWVLARVVDEAPVEARAHHSYGLADPEGFVAMGCDEILVHSHDIALGMGFGFAPPEELAARTLARLFPWAPPDAEPWPTLLWCNGRTSLPGRERLGPNWTWHSAPLEEWDGRAPDVGR
jgi:hypothetical protein